MSKELDAEIAARIFGWKTFAGEPGCGRPPGRPLSLVLDPLPAYSTTIEAAWLVVGAMRDRGLYLNLRGWVQVHDFMACFIMPGGKEYCVTGSDAPMAICRAAMAYVKGCDDE